MGLSIPAAIHPEGGSILDAMADFNISMLQGPVASTTDDAAPFDLVGTSATFTLENAAGTGAASNGVGKLLSSTTNAAQLCQNGEPYLLFDGGRIEIESVIKLADTGQSFVFGIGITNVEPFTTSWTDYVAFFSTDANIKAGCGKNNNSTPGSGTSGETDVDTGTDWVNDTWKRLKIIIEGQSEAKFFVDGTLVARIKADLPNDENLTLHLHTIGSAETVYVNQAIRVRYRPFTQV